MSFDGKEFEEILLYRAREVDEPASRYTMGRYGVMAAMIEGKWTPITSLPDFEGVLHRSGRQFIFDAKTCTQASYALSGGTSKSFKNQYKHLQRRAKFGVLTFLLIHWNERKLKGKIDEAFTSLLPVQDNELWRSVDTGETKQITRAMARMYAIPVTWDIPQGKQTLSPNLYKALLEYQAQVDGPQITHS